MNHNIEYLDWTFTPDKISSGNLYLAASLLASSLEVNSLTAEVECDDPAILDFERNTPLRYYTRPDQPMIFRVQSIKRVGPKLYELTATSTLGLLSEGLHYGGIYTGQEAQAVIADICGTVPFVIKSNLAKIKLYGWLPIASPRDNLAQVLFAIGATLKTDLDGVLRIEGLWDGISGAVTRDDMYTEAAADYEGKVTQVIVTEHQYVPWTEEKQLFEGTAQAGDIITFDEPMHTLTADGFTILASGANWAKVSAGSGVLAGKTYLHNTRQITKDVWTAQEPNIKTVEEATLVSLVNSQACAQRMADYYKCRERVDAPVVYHGELPGDRLATYHPFDKTGVDACLESADITMSNTLKAQEKSLVGFVPQKIEQVEYLDHREVITKNGVWTAPDGVTHIRAVIIQGGRGGFCGHKGEDANRTMTKILTTNPSSGRIYKRTLYKMGAEGGTAGEGGMGGKVLIIDIDISPNQSFNVIIGKSGLGAPYSENSQEGNEGGHTSFGEYSSINGSTSAAGYLDIVTGEIFAAKGHPGINGGHGSGAPQENEYTSEIVEETVTGPDGTIYYPGSNPETYIMDSDKYTTTPAAIQVFAYADSGRGGGPAVGANGNPGTLNGASVSAWCSSTSSSASVSLAPGGNGANAAKGETNKSIGGGGHGGHGGGGAGGYGRARSDFFQRDGTFTPSFPSAKSVGGNGGDGGDGGPGGIILYYAIPKNIPCGQLVDKNNKMVLDRLGRRIVV